MLVLAQRVDRGERREDRVAVVGAAAAVQLVALDHRRPRTEALAPAGHLRLLVEVAVEHDGVARRAAGARDVDEDHRRARRRQLHDLERRALGELLLAPSPRAASTAFSMWPCSLPLGIEHRRLVRDLDVVDERRDDRRRRTSRRPTWWCCLRRACAGLYPSCLWSARGKGENREGQESVRRGSMSSSACSVDRR